MCVATQDGDWNIEGNSLAAERILAKQITIMPSRKAARSDARVIEDRADRGICADLRSVMLYGLGAEN